MTTDSQYPPMRLHVHKLRIIPGTQEMLCECGYRHGAVVNLSQIQRWDTFESDAGELWLGLKANGQYSAHKEALAALEAQVDALQRENGELKVKYDDLWRSRDMFVKDLRELQVEIERLKAPLTREEVLTYGSALSAQSLCFDNNRSVLLFYPVAVDNIIASRATQPSTRETK